MIAHSIQNGKTLNIVLNIVEYFSCSLNLSIPA